MDIPSIIIVDTNGDLSKDAFKINLDKTTISAALTREVAETRVLNIALNNARLSAIPNIQNSTYITFLTYNGTLGYSKKVFSQIVVKEVGVFDANNPPTITYDPNTVSYPNVATLDDVVIDIKMYNGTIDIIRYSEGILNTGEKSYYVSSIRSFPTQVTQLPNVSSNRVFMDGWYSYTTIIFRNIVPGGEVIKDSFYGYNGFIFKASVTGEMLVEAETGDIYIVPPGGNFIEDGGIEQVENTSYTELLFSLNEATGVSAHANNVYIHSQLLVSDQLRDAITKEVLEAVYKDCTDYVEFQTWQKLTLKRMAAAVMFENELFENAQIIMESARAICTSGKYNANSNC